MPEAAADQARSGQCAGAPGEAVDERRLVETNCRKLQQLLRREGIDAVLAVAPDNWRYLTGVPLMHSLFLTVLNVAVLRVDGGFASLLALEGFGAAMRARAPWHDDIEELPFRRTGEPLQPMCVDAWPMVMSDRLARLGLRCGRIALDAMLPYGLKDALQAALPQARFVDAGRLLREARLVKGPEEIKALRAACRFADQAMADAFAAVARRSSELEIAATIEHSFRIHGAEHSGFTPLVFAGVPEIVGIPKFSRETLRDGQLVRIDLGGCAHGYYSCIGRTALIGPANRRVTNAFAAVQAALAAGVATARPGATNVEVHAAMARAMNEGSGGEHALDWYGGHGLGLGAHEEPMIGSADSVTEIVLEPGMCLALEPALMVPGHGWLGLEDDIVITDSGCSVMSAARIGLEPQ